MMYYVIRTNAPATINSVLPALTETADLEALADLEVTGGKAVLNTKEETYA